MKFKLILIALLIIILCNIFFFSAESNEQKIEYSINTEQEIFSVKINLEPYSEIYEGDIINCEITGEPTEKYWYINNQKPHNLFYGDDAVIFDPEPTPLDEEYVELKVEIKNGNDFASDTVKVKIKRIYFGDIHWHSTLCDGMNSIDKMYENAIKDNYLDFASYSGHAEWIDGIRKSYLKPKRMFGSLFYLKVVVQNIIQNKLKRKSDWDIAKQKAIEYYKEGKFTTFLGFEWTACENPNFHINFYYKDVYPEAGVYSSPDVLDQTNSRATLDDIFKTMSEEWDKGHLNVGFPHHPQHVKTDWSYFANEVDNSNVNKILRGVEVFSTWGTAIGQEYTPNLPYNWPYTFIDVQYLKNAWAENAMWEWATENKKGERFALMASSDIHTQSRPGSAKSSAHDISYPYNPAGVIAAYSVHNSREEIWDAMNTCKIYASQLLKIRANVKINCSSLYDGELAYGNWINCTSPLKIRITALSTFPGDDNSGKTMCPHGYSKDELDYPISDIWLIKNDKVKGQPWCKIIEHIEPNDDLVVATFEDPNVEPYDFYWVAIRQKGNLLTPDNIPFLIKIRPRKYKKWTEDIGNRDEYMAFIGPIFIDNVN